MLQRIGIASNAVKNVRSKNRSASSALSVINEVNPRNTYFPADYQPPRKTHLGSRFKHRRLFSSDSNFASKSPATQTNSGQSTPSPKSQTILPSSDPPKPSPSTPPRSLSPNPKPDPNTAHTSLQTFLSHANRTSLSQTTTTYLGTRYEYLTLEHLTTQLAFHLTRVGGRGDSGIDLLGTWPLPAILRGQDSLNLNNLSTSTQSGSDGHRVGDGDGDSAEIDNAIRVVIQCKRLARVAGPNLIRELEGSFRGAPSGWRGEGALGVMVCSRAATKGVRDAMGRSARGLVWIMLEEIQSQQNSEFSHRDTGQASSEDLEQDDAEDQISTVGYSVPRVKIRQFLFNAAAASKCGLEGVNVGMKYDETGNQKDVQLMWQGNPIRFANQQVGTHV